MNYTEKQNSTANAVIKRFLFYSSHFLFHSLFLIVLYTPFFVNAEIYFILAFCFFRRFSLPTRK